MFKPLVKKLFGRLKVWLGSCLFLIKEFFKFIFNLPGYFGRVFEGFNIFAESYRQLVEGLKGHRQSWDNIKPKDAETVRYFVKETIRLRKEQEKIFSGLSTIFIAILALVISILAIILRLRP